MFCLQKNFKCEMDDFQSIFKRYVTEKEYGQDMDWDKIKSPAEDQVIQYKKLQKTTELKQSLSKLAVLKLNVGLGTTMVIILIKGLRWSQISNRSKRWTNVFRFDCKTNTGLYN